MKRFGAKPRPTFRPTFLVNLNRFVHRFLARAFASLFELRLMYKCAASRYVERQQNDFLFQAFAFIFGRPVAAASFPQKLTSLRQPFPVVTFAVTGPYAL